ncbi:MAG: ATP synthase F1 subunit epsilon [Bryobacteraceae bacterium]
MADTFRLEVATPERQLIGEAVREASIPGLAGELGILPGHAPLLGEVGAGELRYTLATGEKHTMVVFGGWIEVNNDVVRVLAQSAERINEIDLARAEAAFARARERAGRLGTDQVDLARALNAMKRAQARLAAAKSAQR